MDEVLNSKFAYFFSLSQGDEFLVLISSYGQLPSWRTLLASLLERYLPLDSFWVHVKVHPS